VNPGVVQAMRGFVCLALSEQVFTNRPGVTLDDVILALCRWA
jgi:hypothetical protein